MLMHHLIVTGLGSIVLNAVNNTMNIGMKCGLTFLISNEYKCAVISDSARRYNCRGSSIICLEGQSYGGLAAVYGGDWRKHVEFDSFQSMVTVHGKVRNAAPNHAHRATPYLSLCRKIAVINLGNRVGV
jgi:hypothetical protein